MLNIFTGMQWGWESVERAELKIKVEHVDLEEDDEGEGRRKFTTYNSRRGIYWSKERRNRLVYSRARIGIPGDM